MRVRLHGPFRVFDVEDRDITPNGMKERGLLALVLLAPDQRRARSWIQDKLWSDRAPEQASASFRQALSKVRKSLGRSGDRVKSDRSMVWMDPPLPIEDAMFLDGAKVLDDIDIVDPEFVDWLRQQRLKPLDAQDLRPEPQRPFARIYRVNRSVSDRSDFGLRALSQRIAGRLAAMVDLDVIEVEHCAQPSQQDSQPAVQVELECLDDREMTFFLLRVTGPPNGRIIWSGRLAVEARLSDLWTAPEVTRAVNQASQAAANAATPVVGLTPMAAIQKATQRRYEFDRHGLIQAEELLCSAMNSELRGLALAWRGMIRLDEVMEFRESDPDRIAEAIDFAGQAVRLGPDNPMILAMASEVTVFLTGDVDKAAFFANRAVALDDQEPDALAALGRTLSFEGKDAEAHRVALAAQHYAQGSPYSCDWDLMAGVAKFRIGDLQGAYDMMLTCHRKMPFGRHALRYLTVLSFLTDRPDDAIRYAERLRRLEPDFNVDLLRGAYAPLSFPHTVELMDRVREKLA